MSVTRPLVRVLLSTEAEGETRRSLDSQTYPALEVVELSARSLAPFESTAAYVAVLEPGCQWHPDFVETSVNTALELSADMVFHNWTERSSLQKSEPGAWERHYHWQSFEAASREGWQIMYPQETRAMALDSCFAPLSSLLFRRSAFAPGKFKLGLLDGWAVLLSCCVRTPCKLTFSMRPALEREARRSPFQLPAAGLREMRNDLSELLSPAEYARLSAHLFLLDWHQRNRSWRLALTLLQGLAHSPADFWQQLARLRA